MTLAFDTIEVSDEKHVEIEDGDIGHGKAYFVEEGFGVEPGRAASGRSEARSGRMARARDVGCWE